MPPSPGTIEQGVLAGCAPDFHEVHTEKKAQGMSFTLAQLRPMIQSTLYFAKYGETENRDPGHGPMYFWRRDGHGAISTWSLWMPVPKKHKYAPGHH